MPTLEEARSWRRKTLVDVDGDKVGTVADVYVDRQSGEPEWVTVKTGLFGHNVSFVPLRDAQPDSGNLRIPYEKSQVKDAPNVDPDSELSPEEERTLYEFYGRSDYDGPGEHPESRDEADTPRNASRPRPGALDGEPERGAGRGDDLRAEDAVTRSEDELQVRTERREVGRARLRKLVTTENVEETVPVRREVAHVSREPLTEDNVEQAMSGPDIAEAEHEVTLHEEVPVVEKRTVPKERIRLEKELIGDTDTVSGEVRKERVEGEGDIRE
jgi:stress response protein YsnF